MLAACVGAASAAQTVNLPKWVCTHPDDIFGGPFEAGQSPVPSDPSLGSGGATGSLTRYVHVAGLGAGTQAYYVYVPSNYTPSRTWPLLLALHGVGPYPDTYAKTTRDDWVTAANASGFIVAAPTANEKFFDSPCNCYGVSWLVPPQSGPSDYDEFAAIRADLESAYNVERTRIYGWGFSAGGSVMHDLGVNTYSTAFNASTMAAYGVSAGILGGPGQTGLACYGLSNTDCDALLAGLPRRIPLDVHVGTNDPTGVYSYAQSDHTQFLSQGWLDGTTIFYNAFPSTTHSYTIVQLSEIWQNLCPNAVIP